MTTVSIIDDVIVAARGWPANLGPATIAVPPDLFARLRMATNRDFSRRVLLEIYGLPVVTCNALDGHDEWLLVPRGQSVELAVRMFLARKAAELARIVPKLHGLREAALMEDGR